MYFFVFAPLLEDKKVINKINFFAFSRLNKKDPDEEKLSSRCRFPGPIGPIGVGR